MKLKELIEILQTFEDQETDVVIFYDEFGYCDIVDIRYDKDVDSVIISNFELQSK